MDPLEHLRKMMSGMFKEPNYEIAGSLSPEDLQEWKEIQKDLSLARNMSQEADARRSLFWTRLERKTGIYDENMKIEDGMLYVEKKGSKENTPLISPPESPEDS